MGCFQGTQVLKNEKRSRILDKCNPGRSPFYKSNIKSNKLENLSALMDDLLKEIKTRLKIIKPVEIQKIFSAYQYEGRSDRFHQKTNEIGNTIVVIMTADNNVFGGFTCCKWKANQMYQYETDEEAKSFLFKVQKQGIKYYNLKKGETKAIMNDQECGPVFGEGHDIHISDNCLETECWANLGKSYECKFPFGSRKANSELSSVERFKVQEYEIWRLMLDDGAKD